MPGGVGNFTRALAASQSTNAPPIVPQVPAATSIAAERALHVAATMLNNILSTAMASSERASSKLGLTTTTQSITPSTTDFPSSSSFSTDALETLVPSSTTEFPMPPVPEQHAGVFIYGFCLVLIPTATILGNLLVIISVLRFKALHSAINFLILGLAVADLLVAVFVMPYAVYVYVQDGFWFLGPLMCDIYSASDVACSTASILLLAVISFDRYRAVSRPIQYSRQSQNIKRVIMILIAIWLISLALASPIVLGVNHRPADASPYECRFYNPEFSIGSSIVSFVIPCVLVLFVYIRIMIALRKREKAAKVRRMANQQETHKGGDISNEEHDAGGVVMAPAKFYVDSDVEAEVEELCSLLLAAVNVLMLALPTIQKRMKRFERHQKAVNEAGDLFCRASFARTLFMPRAIGMLSAQSYLLSSAVSSSTPPTQTNLDHHNQLTNSQTNNSPRLSPFKNEAARRKSFGIAVPSPRKQQRRPSHILNPSIISSATQALSSACVSAVAAVSISENSNKNEVTPRRCRFSSFAETKEYDVESEEDQKSHLDEEELDETEAEDEDSESDDYFEDEDYSSTSDRPNNLSAAISQRVRAGIQNLTNSAAAAIASHRLSLAEPSLRRFAAPPPRKMGMNQASSARNSFVGQTTSQALGLSSLMPLLASHESFRRCSDSVSQIRSNSTAGMEHHRLSPTTNQTGADLRPFSTSPTVRPEAWQTLTPRASPAIFSSPTNSLLFPHRESDAAKSSISNNSFFTFSTYGGSLSARSSINTCIPSNDELLLNVANLKYEEKIEEKIKEEILASVVSPTETTTTTIPAESITPLASPARSPIKHPVVDTLPFYDLQRQSSTQRRSQANREKIWQARARFFRTGNYASDPVIHSKSPLMLRRFVLDVDNDPTSRSADEHDIGNSSSPLSSSDSLSDNLHVVTNDFVSEAPTSMSRKSSELDSSGQNYASPKHITHGTTNRVNPKEKPAKQQESVIRRFNKSFHANHRGLALPNVTKATELFRNLSKRSPKLFRPSASPSSTNSVPVMTASRNVDRQPIRKKLSYTSGDLPITRPYGLARRKSESYAASVKIKIRSNFQFSDANLTKIFNNHQTRPSPIQEIGIALISSAEPQPIRKTSQRYPGTLTSSTLCEEMDYVDVDSALHDTQISRVNGIEPDSLTGRQRSPVPYSEETTSSATDINLTSPIQSIAIPIVPPTVDVNTFFTEVPNESNNVNNVNNGQLKNSMHGSLIIENQSAKEINHKSDELSTARKTSRSNGKNSHRDEVSSPSVTFKIPGKEGRSIRRLSSAMGILESTKLLEKPPIPNSQSSNSMAVSPKHSKTHSRSFSQKLSSVSSNLIASKAVENSMESCYSSSQSQATNTTAGVYACSTPTPTKNLESKLKMVKRAINRKESSLKRKVNKAQRKEKRATKTLGIVVGIFLICWVPFFSINILNAICIMLESPSCEVGFSPFFYATWLGYTNSFINPIIYTIFNTEFRRAFKSLLLGRTSARRQRARHV